MLQGFDILALAVGWLLAVLIGLIGFRIVWLMYKGDIDLKNLVSEPSGDASLSRFQFLIFTFVIAMSLFLIVLSQDPPKFPPIGGDIFALLGISGGSYLVSKGIQTSRDTEEGQVKEKVKEKAKAEAMEEARAEAKKELKEEVK